ncbi:peptidyl-prolyl cis-trans isomerase cyclophilin type [Geitlerinema sp. PCC 7407]|nr:peptidyl-prolyl cis-trans isomerase cyclophilin type [Geitlerinema sp. PCC 7407]
MMMFGFDWVGKQKMHARFQQWLISFVVLGTLVLSGCSAQQAATPPDASASASATTPAASTLPPRASAELAALPRLNGKATVTMTVKGSPIVIEVDGTNAPITAGNFVDLVRRGVYDGLVFHRVVRDPEPFVVQGGDPQSKDPNFPPAGLGTGSFVDPETQETRYIPLEIVPQGTNQPIYGKTLEEAGNVSKVPKLKHRRGAVAMARSSAPNSASAQFYFALADLQFLDGNYAVFGYVTQGMDVVDKIQQGDRIESAEVTSGLDNLKQPAGQAQSSSSPSPAGAASDSQP